MPLIEKLNNAKHSMRILLILRREGRLNLTSIRDKLGVKYYGGMANSVNTLEETGLIQKELEPPLSIYVTLTPLGEKVAEKVAEIQSLFPSKNSK